MPVLRWIDRNLWSIPAAVFVVAELTLSVWSTSSRTPVLLAAASPAARLAVYSSLTGSSSALLGLALAAVAILAAFPPRATPSGQQPTQSESRLGRARTNVIGSLLVACLFLLGILVTATLALAIDSKHFGNSAVTTIVESSGTASVAGLLIGGLGLALVIVERSRQQPCRA